MSDTVEAPMSETTWHPPTQAERDARTVALWRQMTPEARDYDRLVACRIPQAVLAADGSVAWATETAAGREQADRYWDGDDEAVEAGGCYCFKSPPCSWCLTHCPDCHARFEDGEDYDTHHCERAS